MRLGMPYLPFIPQPPISRPYKNNVEIKPPTLTEATRQSPENDSPFLEIFGIQLDFDDFLILGLLFFLYVEGVEDQMLYMILIILLLT